MAAFFSKQVSFWIWFALALVNGVSFLVALEVGTVNYVSLAAGIIAFSFANYYAQS